MSVDVVHGMLRCHTGSGRPLSPVDTEETVSDFQTRRLEFADKLRNLREQAELTGKAFAELVGWPNAKVSKIETGRQTPSDPDLLAWLDALNVSKDRVEPLRAELRELRIEQMAWRRQLRTGHRARQEEDASSERDASVIRAVDVAAVPGLLQTPDYARAIFRSQTALLEVPDDVDGSVQARMDRQRVLYDSTKTIEILVTEAGLRHLVCSPGVMVGQLDRLTTVTGLPNIRFGVLPLDRQLPHIPWHGYWIVDDLVLVETITAELRIRDADQVAIYNTLTDRLWSVALEGQEARALLARIAAGFAEETG